MINRVASENRLIHIVMKSLLFLIIAVSGWRAIKAMDEDEALNALKNFSGDCEPKPSEDDIKNIIRSEQNVPNSTMCYRLCLMNKMNLMKDCKLDGDSLYSLMQIVFEDKEDEVHEIANLCNDKVTCTEECNAAHDYAMCILNEVKERGWPLDDLNF